MKQSGGSYSVKPRKTAPAPERNALDTLDVSPFASVPLLENGQRFGGGVGDANMLIWGENLAAMRALPGSCIQLIYADPPFFTNREFNHLYREDGKPVFSDVWYDGLDGYIAWLRPRLMEMRRLLKDSGSIYIHIDWHASHYVKVLADSIFGYGNFLNEVIWHYRDPGGTVRDRFKKKHDTILLYAKSTGKHKFNVDAVRMEYSRGTISQGERGIVSFGRRTKLHSLGKVREDVWDIPIINSQAKERVGYPTQKPVRLLETIIKASSSDGDTVADFFCGSGTTAVVASSLGRKWVAADSNEVAINTTLKRLKKERCPRDFVEPRLLTACIAGSRIGSPERNAPRTTPSAALGLAESPGMESCNDGRSLLEGIYKADVPTGVGQSKGTCKAAYTLKFNGCTYHIPAEIVSSPFDDFGHSGKCLRLLLPPVASLDASSSNCCSTVTLRAYSSGSGILMLARIELEFPGLTRKKAAADFAEMHSGTALLKTGLKGRCVATATVSDTTGGRCIVRREFSL